MKFLSPVIVLFFFKYQQVFQKDAECLPVYQLLQCSQSCSLAESNKNQASFSTVTTVGGLCFPWIYLNRLLSLHVSLWPSFSNSPNSVPRLSKSFKLNLWYLKEKKKIYGSYSSMFNFLSSSLHRLRPCSDWKQPCVKCKVDLLVRQTMK